MIRIRGKQSKKLHRHHAYQPVGRSPESIGYLWRCPCGAMAGAESCRRLNEGLTPFARLAFDTMMRQGNVLIRKI